MTLSVPSVGPPGLKTPAVPPPAAAIDARESLANSGEVGPIASVSIPAVMITSLRGIMLDFDPNLYDPNHLPPGATASPAALLEKFVEPMLARHPVYAKAEVRDSGRGLHVLLWLDPPVVFEGEADRAKWAEVVTAVQKALPADPDAPGLTALTRPPGSVNSKTGRTVAVLRPGQPVAPGEILKLVDDLRARPFEVVAGLLFGKALSPCPVCHKPGTRLGVKARQGVCYGGCGKVTLADLFGVVYAAAATAREG